MLSIIALAAAAHAGLPYTPASIPFDNDVARVALSAGEPGVVTKPHVHLTSRVMIYFEPGTNTIRFPGGKVSPEVFKAGDVQWNDAMGTHTAEITAPGPVDIVHVELKSPPVAGVKLSARDALAVDPAHFTREMDNGQVRVLRLRLGKGEKSQPHDEPFQRLLVPLTAIQWKTTDAGGAVKTVAYAKGAVQWLMPGTEAQENTGAASEAIIVEFKR